MNLTNLVQFIALLALANTLHLKSFGQCSTTSFETLQKILSSNAPEDIIIKEEFDKYDSQEETVKASYGKCKKILATKEGRTYENYNENVIVNTNKSITYFTYDRNAYLKSLSLIKKFKFIGYYEIGSFKITYYSDGKLYYGYTVIVQNIFDKTAINHYKIDFLKAKPFINKTN